MTNEGPKRKLKEHGDELNWSQKDVRTKKGEVRVSSGNRAMQSCMICTPHQTSPALSNKDMGRAGDMHGRKEKCK